MKKSAVVAFSCLSLHGKGADYHPVAKKSFRVRTKNWVHQRGWGHVCVSGIVLPCYVLTPNCQLTQPTVW